MQGLAYSCSMMKRPPRSIVCSFCCFVLWISGIAPGAARTCAQNARTREDRDPVSSREIEDIPLYSVPQYLPCPNQTRSYLALAKSFTSGRLPTETEISGSWVLIGSWLYRDSHPDLNCTGIVRGRILEWVMFANGLSLRVNMAGMIVKSAFGPGSAGNLKFTMDLGGEANPVFQCRLTQQHTLVCLGSPYYSGSEFKKMPVHCEPSEFEAAIPGSPMRCSRD